MTTTRLPQGRMTIAADLKPGDLIYLRPDHAKYDPAYFAIVLPHGRFMPINGIMWEGFQDGERAVEKVGQRHVQYACAVSRAEVAQAVQYVVDLAEGRAVFAYTENAHRVDLVNRCARALGYPFAKIEESMP